MSILNQICIGGWSGDVVLTMVEQSVLIHDSNCFAGMGVEKLGAD